MAVALQKDMINGMKQERAIKPPLPILKKMKMTRTQPRSPKRMTDKRQFER